MIKVAENFPEIVFSKKSYFSESRRVTGFRLYSSVDSWAILELEIAIDPVAVRKEGVNRAGVSPDVEFTWESFKFRGSFLKATQESSTRIALCYVDDLFLLHKIEHHQAFNRTALKGVLTTLCAEAGLSSDFQGDFSEKIEMIVFPGKTLLEVIQIYARNIGFYFFYDPGSSKVLFFRTGTSRSKQTFANSSEVQNVSWNNDLSFSADEITATYLCSENLGVNDQVMTFEKLHQPAQLWRCDNRKGAYQQSGAFKGKRQVYVSSKDEFESAKKNIPLAQSKRALNQWMVKASSLYPVCQLASSVNFEGDEVSPSNKGSHFVTGVEIEGNSVKPRFTFFAGSV